MSASAGPSGPPLDAAFVRSVWPRILETLQSVAPQDLKYLRSVSAEAQDAETLAVIVPGGSSFLFEQIEDPSRKTRLANAAAKVIGRPVSIRLRLGPSPAGAEAETSTAAARERIQVQARGHREARNDPAVQLLVLRFDGQVLNIEEDGSRPAEERTEPVEESFSPLSEPVEEED